MEVALQCVKHFSVYPLLGFYGHAVGNDEGSSGFAGDTAIAIKDAGGSIGHAIHRPPALEKAILGCVQRCLTRSTAPPDPSSPSGREVTS